jgi:uncharacterized membrane protein
MEALVILLFIILIVMLLVLRSGIFERMDRLEQEIMRLRQTLPTPGAKKEGVRVVPPVGTKEVTPPVAGVPVVAEPVAPEPVVAEPVRPVETEPFKPISRPIAPKTRVEPVEPSERGGKDLEKFIGENLISKIGIAILVLAIGFFVKYAIDNDWIGPIGRVGIGVLCGGILIGLAHWLRKSYTAFSSVLVGGGLAVLYFTIALAYHQYQLFGQTAAFIIMLVITAFSVLLSLLYDRQELAVIALVGGFLTPFLVSNGSGNYRVLFSYLLILNAGLLVIAYNKAWRLLNILAFCFTAILFASWVLQLPYDAPASTYRGGLWFASVFYLLFFVINIAHTIKENKKFIASDFGILLVNTCLYAGVSLYMMTQLGLDRYKGLFCAVMGIFHLATSWFLFRKNRVDKNILYLFIGITMSFVSLTAPLQLHGHYITLFWASEAVLLYWLFLKSQIKLIRLAALVVWGAMLISLLIDLSRFYYWDTLNPSSGSEHRLHIIFNPGFLTGLYAAVSCWAIFRLRKGTTWYIVSLITAGVLLFCAGALEINYQFNYYYPSVNLSLLYILLYAWLLILVYCFFLDRMKEDHFKWLLVWLPLGGVLAYLLSLPEVFNIQEDMLEGHRYKNFFAGHWTGVVLVILIFYWMVARQRVGKLKAPVELFTWLACLTVVILVSAEGQLLINMLYYSPKYSLDELERVYNKTGLPILWGLCSFAFMWMGMRHKFKQLRIISLVLFSITLLKLFLFDIRNIPVAGKIAAFFCLGVLLLVVSFMYQRLKKIIIENGEKKPD